jgi:dTMP kinase
MIPPLMHVPNNLNFSSRGAFIVLEGVDRCGKTTQCSILLKHLLSIGIAAMVMRFPDRTTSVGTLINGYLQSTQSLDDRAIHLLFSANRWEAVPTLTKALSEGTTVICDRYAHSGVAFSSAKGLSTKWCQGPDIGLPAPDAVIFLDLSQELSEQRGGYVENVSNFNQILLHFLKLLFSLIPRLHLGIFQVWG